MALRTESGKKGYPLKGLRDSENEKSEMLSSELVNS